MDTTETLIAPPTMGADGTPAPSPVTVQQPGQGPIDWLMKHKPQRVAMVGLGPSANAFWLENAQFDTAKSYDAVWALNRSAVSFRHDLSFDMHDLRALVRKHPHEMARFVYAERPIVTLAHYPEFPTTVAFPIEAALEKVGHDILNSTPAYMVAFAMMIGVKEIWLYGMDFHYENVDRAEAGGQGMAYMLGMCQAMGISYKIPSTSSLLDAYRVLIVEVDGKQQPMRPLYGYSESEDTPDPRIPKGAKVFQLHQPSQQQMTAHQPRYRLGEAEVGDKKG